MVPSECARLARLWPRLNRKAGRQGPQPAAWLAGSYRSHKAEAGASARLNEPPSDLEIRVRELVIALVRLNSRPQNRKHQQR